MTRRVSRATLDRLFPPDVVPYVEVLIVPVERDAPLRPVVDVVLVPVDSSSSLVKLTKSSFLNHRGDQ